MPSVAELKASLKEIGMSQSGDKGTLEWRLKTYRKCISQSLKTWDGSNPCSLNAAKLRTACAKAGVSCIGNNDENLELLVTHLESTAPSTSGDTGNSQRSDGNNGGNVAKVNAAQVIKRVLELDELDEHIAILNIATTGSARDQINSQTPTNIIRKAYLKLSVMIHPDRCHHSDATKAFQALVKAFDRVSSPTVVDSDSSSGNASDQKTIARSNQGCKRTRVCCPRCKEPWSERKLEGNPDYYYNFMMMGLKQFHCSTCLCLFGEYSLAFLVLSFLLSC